MTRRRDRLVGTRDVTRWSTPIGRAISDGHTRLSRAIGPHRALIGTLVFGGTLAAAATELAARTYDAVTGEDGIAALDLPAQRGVKRVRSRWLDDTAAGIAYLFGPVGMPILTVAAALALSLRRRELAPFVLISAAGAGALALTVRDKRLVDRVRPPRYAAIPPYDRSPSFPSGHTLNATAVTGTLAYLLALRQRDTRRQAATFGAAGTVSVIVGLSRVLLGAHWLSDVIFGWCAGVGWVAAIVTSDRLFLTSLDRLRRRP